MPQTPVQPSMVVQAEAPVATSHFREPVDKGLPVKVTEAVTAVSVPLTLVLAVVVLAQSERQRQTTTAVTVALVSRPPLPDRR